METWFADNPEGMSEVLKVERYRGAYPQWFSWVVRVTAPRTKRRWMEIVQ